MLNGPGTSKVHVSLVVSKCVHSETQLLTRSISCLILPFSEPLGERERQMATVGYARVSSVGQSLDVQLEKLKGCDKVFKEWVRGAQLVPGFEPTHRHEREG
jgi:hypothetical protein